VVSVPFYGTSELVDDERQVSILTLVYSSGALVGGTVFALQLYLRRVPTSVSIDYPSRERK
jgi:hypothetical protein